MIVVYGFEDERCEASVVVRMGIFYISFLVVGEYLYLLRSKRYRLGKLFNLIGFFREGVFFFFRCVLVYSRYRGY